MDTTKPTIFLDVDGVLNSLGSCIALGGPSSFFDPVSVGLIEALCAKAGAQIVVSSTWRMNRTVAQIRADLAKPGAACLGKYIVSRTDEEPGIRGAQIARWIQRKDFRGRYCIIDDDSDMLPEQKANFVHTSWDDGFRILHYRNAMKLLKPDHADARIIVPREEPLNV